MALQSFVSAGILATSLAAALLSISSAHLGAVGTVASERINVIASDSSMNIHVRFKLFIEANFQVDSFHHV